MDTERLLADLGIAPTSLAGQVISMAEKYGHMTIPQICAALEAAQQERNEYWQAARRAEAQLYAHCKRSSCDKCMDAIRRLEAATPPQPAEQPADTVPATHDQGVGRVDVASLPAQGWQEREVSDA